MPSLWRGRLSALLPWVFVAGIAAGTMLPARHWLRDHWLRDYFPWAAPSTESQWPDRETEAMWRRASAGGARHQVDVLYTVDGDTFGARVHLWPGSDLTTRVRLRGIDAPELRAQCADELKRAEAATDALRALLAEGSVSIFNIGPDKYQGRVVADAATKRTPSVSAALLAAGHARTYDGGHRQGWCGAR